MRAADVGEVADEVGDEGEGLDLGVHEVDEQLVQHRVLHRHGVQRDGVDHQGQQRLHEVRGGGGGGTERLVVECLGWSW